MSQGPEASREEGAIARRAGVVGLGTLLSRVLGLLRDVTLAAVFPAAMTDAFWVAFKIPNALRQILAEGAMTSAVVPVLADVRAREGGEGARRYYAKVRGLSLLALLVVTALGVVFAEPIVDVWVSSAPAQRARTVLLTRWVFPYILFMGSAALGMAALNTERRFAVAAFSPGLLNVAFVATSFGLPTWLAARGADPALAMAVGALFGGLLQVVAQLPALRAIGYLGLPRLDLRDADVRRTLVRLGPMALGVGIYYVDLIVSARLLSGLGDGPQSWFSWAQRLCDFPQGIFVMALQTAALPSLATLHAQGKLDELRSTLSFALRVSLFVAIPVTALFAAASAPIVVAMFQRGAFDATQASETARSLVAQGLGIWAVAAVRTLVAAFFAAGDTRTPVVVSLVDLAVLVALAWALVVPLGHVGVALAVTGSSIAQMLLLWVFLHKKLRGIRTLEVLGSAAKTTAAALVAGAAALFAGRAGALVPQTALGRLVPAGAAGLAFVVVFVVAASLLGSRELSQLKTALTRRLRRRRAPR